MDWFTTKVLRLDLLASELQRLDDDGHTIFSVSNIDGSIVIISNIP